MSGKPTKAPKTPKAEKAPKAPKPAAAAPVQEPPLTPAEERQILDGEGAGAGTEIAGEAISPNADADRELEDERASESASNLDRLPAPDHEAVKTVGQGLDFPELATRLLRASKGHGASRDRELMMEAAVALAELGGFNLPDA